MFHYQRGQACKHTPITVHRDTDSYSNLIPKPSHLSRTSALSFCQQQFCIRFFSGFCPRVSLPESPIRLLPTPCSWLWVRGGVAGRRSTLYNNKRHNSVLNEKGFKKKQNSAGLFLNCMCGMCGMCGFFQIHNKI